MSDTFHPHRYSDVFNRVVDRCTKIVRSLDQQVDHIAVRGASGLVVGSVVAYLTGKKLVVIRKEGENPHCYQYVSTGDAPVNVERTVWIDDFISGGGTFEAVIANLHGRPRWVILYSEGSTFMGMGALQVGLARSPYSDYLYENEPTPDMHGRFAWPKPNS